jgi:hypothetical protein
MLPGKNRRDHRILKRSQLAPAQAVNDVVL